MKILIAGQPESGQREILQMLTGKPLSSLEPLAGHVESHNFTTKYFNAECGLWTDEYEDTAEWVREFTSAEAREVREALILYIHTFSHAADSEVAAFVKALDHPSICIAVAKPGYAVSVQSVDTYEELGLEIVPFGELERVVHAAVFDALDTDDALENATTVHQHAEVPRDLDDIMEEMRKARESSTMTQEEKMALADRLAEELT